MTETPVNDRAARPLIFVTLGILIAYVAAQLFGSSLFPAGWSLSFWQTLPSWYGLVWIVASGLLFVLLLDSGKWEHYITSRIAVGFGIVLLLTVMWLLRYDSFLYGGGNLRVAQLSQVDQVVARWFEWGMVSVVSVLYAIAKMFENRPNWAAIHAWQSLSFICTIATLIATILSARFLSKKSTHRLLLFLILFFGGQTPTYFGFIGVEPAVVAVTSWIFYFSLRQLTDRRMTHVLLLWLVSIAGVFLHISLAYLLPTVVYFTVRRLSTGGERLAFVIAGLVYVGMLALFYGKALQSLEFSRSVLFLKGKPPFDNYGLFSLLHLADWLQLTLLLSPMVILAFVMAIQSRGKNKISPLVTGWIIAAVSGLTFIFISDPENGMALDLPRFAAYLAPVSLVLASMISGMGFSESARYRLAAFVAAAAILLPALYLPAMVRVHTAEKYVTAFLNHREIYYRTTCVSFRDVYWTLRELDRTDRWEGLLPVKSADYLTMRGCTYLIQGGNYEEALERLYQTIVRMPYWTEPRSLVAQTQMKLRRFDLAKPHIDTCLMLEPFKREHLLSLYAYYRDLPDYVEAIKAIDRMLTVFPHDPEVKTDQMIILFRAGLVPVADSIADFLLASDSTRAYPYIIKGMVAEGRRDTTSAIRSYKSFFNFGRREPDTAFIRERLNALQSVGPATDTNDESGPVRP